MLMTAIDDKFLLFRVHFQMQRLISFFYLVVVRTKLLFGLLFFVSLSLNFVLN